MCSGVLAQARAGTGIRRLLKVKSHLGLEEPGISTLEACLPKGNDEADTTAKANQARHPAISPEKLAEVDTENVPPTSHAIDLTNAFREDEVHVHLSNEEALANAPSRENGSFVVPKVI